MACMAGVGESAIDLHGATVGASQGALPEVADLRQLGLESRPLSFQPARPRSLAPSIGRPRAEPGPAYPVPSTRTRSQRPLNLLAPTQSIVNR